MDQTAKNIRILMLEDVPTDAELEKIELQDAGLGFTSLRVDTREAFEQALEDFKPDIILADYRLPSYSGRDALEYTCRTHPQIPVIMVTGALGDEAAVELLKMGARDYVLKGSLARLAPAIKRALSEEISVRNRKLAEEKYLALFNEAMDGIVLIDCKTWQVVDCNPEFEMLTGRTLEQLKELKMWEVMTPEQHELYRQTLLEIQKTGSGRGSNFSMQKPGGEIVLIEFSAKFLNIRQQCFIQSIIHDITGRKQAEEKLRETRDYLENLFNHANAPIIVWSPSYQITMFNHAFEHLTGRNADEVIGKQIDILFPADRKNEALSHIYQTKTGERWETIEITILHSSGSVKTALWNSATLYSADGKTVVATMAQGQDITDRKLAEAALLRANRALKTLSAGNLALVRAANENVLLREVTNIIVEQGGYRLAVVDYANDNPEKSITPMAWSEMKEDEYWALHLSWADTEYGQLPVSRAIRSGATHISRDISSDPGFKPWRDAALERGYISNIALPLSGAGRTFGGLSIYSSDADAFDEEEVLLLEELANDLAYGIITLRTRSEHEQHAKILRQSLEQSIQTIAATVEARDRYTAGHQRRVGELAVAIAREMGMPEEQINGIHLAAIIHDLGKIHIPSEILSKPGKLTDIEYMFVKTHPQAGYDILKDVKFPWPIADIILQHHERLDGSGYPQGLKDGQILLESKIISVADVVEAISSHRPYRPALGGKAAMDEIKRGRGSAYDPLVVDTCLRLLADKGFQFGRYSDFNL